jgi:HprK-related kinase A
MYGPPDEGCDKPADFRISVDFDAPLRRIFRQQLTFHSGSLAPYKPVAASLGYPVLEWGMNWCVGRHDFTRLIIHAAVLVRNGRAIILPAKPGSGKSTLSAYLALNGWQLYSDEMTIITPHTQSVAAVYRPICLKNDSIELAKDWGAEDRLTERFVNTSKGDISHLRAMTAKEFSKLGTATIVAVLFPQYTPGTTLDIHPLNAVDAFENLIDHSFNYSILGQAAFETVGHLIDRSHCANIFYDDVAEVDAFMREVVDA